MTPLATDIAVVATSFFAAVVAGIAGFAFGLVSSPVYLRLLPPPDAAAMIIGGGIVMQLYTMRKLPGGAIQWPRLWPFLVGGVVGVPIGLRLLLVSDARTVQVIVGLILVGYSVFMLTRGVGRPVAFGGRAADGAAGLVGGMVGGLVGLSGAPSTIWCTLRGWTKDEQRGVYQPYILMIHVLSLSGLIVSGAVGRRGLIDLALSLGPMLAGAWLGLKLYRRMDERQFRLVVLWLLLAAGASLLA